ncbi:MAG: DMT family transporter [Lachnospiraceae bacterium]|nr:DMT family transporter [Lachnospiraceae bacterium]
MNETNQKVSVLTRPLVVMVLALLCCALWGSAFPCVKIGYELFGIQGPSSQLLFAGYRFVLAGVFTFAAACLMEKRLVTIQRSSIPYVCGQGLLQTTIHYLFFYIGLANTAGSKGAIINGSNAFFAIILAHFLIRNERFTLKKAIGCVFGFAGVVLVNLAPGALGGGFSLTGEGFIVLCSIAYGASSVTMKMISHRENTTVITAYQFMFGGSILILIGLLTGGKVEAASGAAWGMLLYLGILSTVAFSIWAMLLKENPVGRVAIYGFSIPLFGALLSALMLGENIVSWNSVCALVLVCVGILIVNRN